MLHFCWQAEGLEEEAEKKAVGSSCWVAACLESQVAQDKRLLYPEVGRDSSKVAHNYIGAQQSPLIVAPNVRLIYPKVADQKKLPQIVWALAHEW